MPDELDDTTAAEVGHALVRWLVNEDPGGVAGFAPDLDVTQVGDAKAARLGHTLVDLLESLASPDRAAIRLDARSAGRPPSAFERCSS